MQPHEYVIAEALRRLRQNPDLADTSRATLIAQNSASLKEALERNLDGLDNVAVVVCFDSGRPLRTKPRTLEARITVRCTENVPLNREKADFLTALDCAFLAVEALDGEFAHADGDIEHTTPGDGVLEATAKFATTLEYT